MLKTRVVGVGGMGGRFASRFSEGPLKDGVETLVIHTSKKELSKMSVDRPVFIGEETLLDKGAQGDPMAGAGAAERSAKRLVENLIGAEKVCLVSARGGGTRAKGRGWIGPFAGDGRQGPRFSQRPALR